MWGPLAAGRQQWAPEPAGDQRASAHGAAGAVGRSRRASGWSLQTPASREPGTPSLSFSETPGGPLDGPQQLPWPPSPRQVPIHALWSDGRENLLGALLMAGQYVIPEVALPTPSRGGRGRCLGPGSSAGCPCAPGARGCGPQVGPTGEGPSRGLKVHPSPCVCVGFHEADGGGRAGPLTPPSPPPRSACSSRTSCFGARGSPRWTHAGSRPSAPPTCRLWPWWAPT